MPVSPRRVVTLMSRAPQIPTEYPRASNYPDGDVHDNQIVTISVAELRKLINADELKKIINKEEPIDLLSNRKKAFLEFAKIFSVVCVGAINTIDVFGVTLAYGGHEFPRLKDDKENGDRVKHVMLAFTIGMLPFTVCLCGFTHAATQLTKLMTPVAYLVLLELLYLITICCLSGYYLTTSKLEIYVLATVISLVVLAFYFWTFRLPSLRKCFPWKNRESGNTTPNSTGRVWNNPVLLSAALGKLHDSKE